MLLNNLFFIDQLTPNENSIQAIVRIDKNHAIFEGHFPGKPIVPGVCMLQLIKELLEKTEQKKLNLKAAANIKFLAVIDPIVNQSVTASVLIEHRSDVELKINASLFAGDVTFFKLKAALKPA